LSWRLIPASALSAAALAYAVLIATFPDERIYLATTWVYGKSHRDLGTFGTFGRTGTGELKWDGRPGWYAWIELIVPVNALDLHGEGLVDYAKLENITKKNKSETGESRWEPILFLAKRDLTEANLSDTDIRQVEFSDTIVNRANLNRTWAENAHFDEAHLSGAFLKPAQLQGAWLVGAKLQGASLDDAQLQGAWLDTEFLGPE